MAIKIKSKTSVKKKKFTLDEIVKAWDYMYGENFRTEYSGLYRYLKKKENGNTSK